ncbi:MAG TPA: hypothetical protein VK892_04260 [Pyrinomonadaceae bacterium]|nr:hypothetical protein [Pyrinomonadaceae bacterium]
MDLGTKQATSGLTAQEFSTSDAAMDSQTLKDEQERLQGELRERMNAGDAAGVLRIRNFLKNLPELINAAEIAELRQKIDQCTARLAEIREEREEAERIRGARNKILAEKIKDMQDAGLEVRRVDVILATLDNEAESRRVARREYTEQLKNFIEGAELS